MKRSPRYPLNLFTSGAKAGDCPWAIELQAQGRYSAELGCNSSKDRPYKALLKN